MPLSQGIGICLSYVFALRINRHRTRLLSMSQRARSAAGVGLTALLLFGAAAPAQAALSEGRAPPAGGSRLLTLAQAPPAPGPNVEANIAQLHQRLMITPAQESQFQAFANAMRQNARMMPAAPPSPNVNAVEGLRTEIELTQQYLNSLKRMLPALQALYAVLTPGQRQAADQAFRQGPGGPGQ
jgi:periplasmic protein CpxP/Spy